MTHLQKKKKKKNTNTDLEWPKATWLSSSLYIVPQISALTVGFCINMWSKQIKGNRGRQWRCFRKEPKSVTQLCLYQENKSMFAFVSIFFSSDNKGKINKMSWNLPFVSLSDMLTYTWVLRFRLLPCPVFPFLIDNRGVGGGGDKMYMKRCKENVHNQTVSDKQRNRLDLGVLCWFSWVSP